MFQQKLKHLLGTWYHSQTKPGVRIGPEQRKSAIVAAVLHSRQATPEICASDFVK
jgi:hypothetical protein